MLNFGIYGNGNAAWSLCHAFVTAGFAPQFITSRNSKKAQVIADEFGISCLEDISSIPEETQVIIIAVADGAISDVVVQLDGFRGILAHTSGPTPMDVLKNGKAKSAVFYPLQSMVKGTPTSFEKVPLLLEGVDTHTLEILKKLASSISTDVRELSSEKRLALHASAVFVNNFVNHIHAVSREICDRNKVPYDLLLPLIEKTSQIALHGNPIQSQTGPAMRNDLMTMMAHQSILNDSENIIYRTLSEQIQRKHETEL